jgi:hypothetical protein
MHVLVFSLASVSCAILGWHKMFIARALLPVVKLRRR